MPHIPPPLPPASMKPASPPPPSKNPASIPLASTQSPPSHIPRPSKNPASSPPPSTSIQPPPPPSMKPASTPLPQASSSRERSIKKSGTVVPPEGSDYPREVLKNFRQLYKEEEAKLPGFRKLDSQEIERKAVLRLLQEKDSWLEKGINLRKRGPIIGGIPGMNVGERFHGRTVLDILSLHSESEDRIATLFRDGMPLASSIIISGIYRNQELIVQYIPREDSRGLAMSMASHTPVRVIYEEERHDEGTEFTYAGLYYIISCWTKNKAVLRFELERKE